MKKKEQINDINALRFTITEDMNNAFIETLLIKQMLKNPKNSEEKRKLLKQQYENLYSFFIEEFRKNNTKEREIYKRLMTGEK